MKYKVGDKVRIKSFDWYNRCTNGTEVDCGEYPFTSDMKEFCGQERIIANVCQECYFLLGIDDKFVFTDEMIEGLVEEGVEEKLSYEIWRYENIFDPSQYPQSFECPQGYQFKDENGNVINATKIVLEKKEKEYPKTYEECCKVIGINRHDVEIDLPPPYQQNIFNLFKLIICRNAYWKIAGDEMGLGKPWEPIWNDEKSKYTILVVKHYAFKQNYILAFPTPEMRDAFYENFKELIESVKELL